MKIDELERLLAAAKAQEAIEASRAGEAIDLATAIDTFILDSRAGGLAPATVRWYSSLLAAFAKAFSGALLTSITTNDLRQYMVSLAERDTRYDGAGQRPTIPGKLSKQTIIGHQTALNAFWRWAKKEFKLTDNPMEGVKRIRRPAGTPRAIDAADFVALFDAARNDESGHRDRALLAFLADAGARVGEVCSLRQDKLFERQAVVIGKTGSRIVVFSHYTRSLLTLWLSNRTLDASPFVFTSLTTGEGLGTSGVDQVLRRLKRAAGVSGRVNPHSFRHAFAREYLRAGGDAIRLARLLGHDSADTTAAYYAIFTADELAEAHENFSPLRRMLNTAKNS